MSSQADGPRVQQRLTPGPAALAINDTFAGWQNWTGPQLTHLVNGRNIMCPRNQIRQRLVKIMSFVLHSSRAGLRLSRAINHCGVRDLILKLS
jgi:hypothetical protein